MNELAGVAQAFQDSLPRGAEIIVSRIDALDRIGVPVVQAVLLAPDRHALSGYGYGVTELEAQVGALGELCEEAHVGAAIAAAPHTIASYAALVGRLGARAVLDPLTLCLPAGSPYTPDTPLSWVSGQRWPDGEPVLLPAEWVAAHPYQLAGPARLITPITNGLGAGFDLPHALAHALMELLQRDGNSLTYRALDQGVVVDLPQGELGDVDDLLARLHALGIRPVVKLADTSFGLANLYVMGDDAGPADFTLQLSACGEASHPDRARALRKALLEYIGSRSRKAATHGPVETARRVLPPAYLARLLAADPAAEEPRALNAMTAWLGLDAAALRQRLAGPVQRRTSGIAFASLPNAPANDVANSSARLALLAGRLAEAGLGIVWVDCSPDEGPVRVVRAIVPGLESETMSYHRLGRRGVARLRARRDPLLLDAPHDGALRVRLRPEDEASCGGPAWFDAALAARLTDPLYPLYRECGPFAAQRVLAGKKLARADAEAAC